jgi:tRNA-(ms[2]io[6]A)-hydroxylase
MLHLSSTTDPSWAALAARDTDALLLDHAHCEKKAASTAVALLFRYPDREELAGPLSALAREELEHFERVTALLRRRGIRRGRRAAPPYAARLVEIVRKGEPGRLLDTLVCMAFIEARSCERMGILAATLPDAELRAFYADLLESEARHHATYLDLARATGLYADEEIRLRVAQVAAHEASLLAGPPAGPRLHD